MPEEYADIIGLPRHVSRKHPQMSLEARAAQFASFAALVGYDEMIDDATWNQVRCHYGRSSTLMRVAASTVEPLRNPGYISRVAQHRHPIVLPVTIHSALSMHNLL